MPRAIPNTYHVTDDGLHASLTIRTMKGQTHVVLIDPTDLATVQAKQWCIRAATKPRKYFYASTNAVGGSGNKKISLANYLLDPAGKMVARHINGNTLDCRRSNIVEATRQEVSRNTEQPVAVSGHRYIQSVRKGKAFRVVGPRLGPDGWQPCLGTFSTLAAAIAVRDQMLHGWKVAG